ncbi:MAG: tetratricopeptide repeat protein [Myxococcales bacterium]|nr:tetratricopeptide repeat protein [Myxococcales bacterium]MDP3505374.1 tetratricopeptide repeat protein [Myxococcales bacterium]
MSVLHVRLSLVTFALLLAAACATTPEKKAETDPTKAPAETPEVPYEPKASQPADVAAADAPKPAAQPATGGPAPAPAPEPAPPPKPQFEPQLASQFKDAADALRKGDLDTAERGFRSVLDRNAQADHAWTNLGLIAERKGDVDGAEKSYRRALGINPAQDAAWDRLARLSCRTRRCPQIDGELRSTIAQNPVALGPRIALVYAQLQQNKLEAAAGEAKKVLKADERNVRAMQLLAQVFLKDGKVELARLVLENARDVDREDATTQYYLGLAYLKLKQRPQAVESFRLASQLQPDFAEARNAFGAVLVENQDYEGAARELEAAVAAAPEFTLAYVNLASAYRGQQQLPKAIETYQKVLKQRPDYGDIYFNLGIAYLDSEVPGTETVQRFRTAIDYFNQYRAKGGKDERVEQYIKDANKGIEKEERKRERDKKDALRKVEQEKKKIEDEAKAKAEAEAKAKADAEAAAKAEAEGKQKAEADAKKKAEEDAKKKAADDAKNAALSAAEAKKKAADDAKAAAKAEAEAKKKAAADAKAQAALEKAEAAAKAKADAAARKQAAEDAKKKPAAKLKDDDEPAPAPTPAPKPPAGSGKLSDDEK